MKGLRGHIKKLAISCGSLHICVVDRLFWQHWGWGGLEVKRGDQLGGQGSDPGEKPGRFELAQTVETERPRMLKTERESRIISRTNGLIIISSIRQVQVLTFPSARDTLPWGSMLFYHQGPSYGENDQTG